MKPTIFVQIASYRDLELIPTLIDLVDQSAHPQHLRIVVCWQHALNEVVGGFIARGLSHWQVHQRDGDVVHMLRYGDAHIELIDVYHLHSQGACWARNKIQQRYDGECYTLQLDSHHRFVPHWDLQLIGMLESLRPTSARPLLTTYLPAFDPQEDDPTRWGRLPTTMSFDRFTPEGAVFFMPADIPDWEARQAPIPARFYSAHFAFADGSFAEEVQHDPAYFFHGEEISIGVRAFTHGYDLYHPHRLIAWHEYTRKGRVKMWDEHGVEAKAAGIIDSDWGERNARSHQRNRTLFGMNGADTAQVDFGKYGFGTARSLRQFEAYAGISFAHRAVQQAVIDKLPPTPQTAPVSESDWLASLTRSNDVRICVHRNDLGDIEAIEHCDVAVHDTDGNILHQQTLGNEALRKRLKGDWLDYRLVFFSEFGNVPERYVLRPRGKAADLFTPIERMADRPQ